MHLCGKLRLRLSLETFQLLLEQFLEFEIAASALLALLKLFSDLR